jgi:Transglycosylase SLT domain
MDRQQKAAHEIADGLEQLGHDLRASFNRSVRQLAPVTFSGPLASLFDRRLQAHLVELNTILASMGVTTDDLRILGRQDGELALRRRSTGYVKDPGKPGHHGAPDREKDKDEPAGDTTALPAQYRTLMPLVERAAERHGVSPALLLAIMDRETGDPRRIGFGGRNPAITNGNDFGLMQINRSAHPGFFAHHDWRDPAANIDYGATVLKDNLRHYDGDVTKAAAAYNAGPGAVDRALGAGRSADSATTGGDYGSDVARRYAYFRKLLAG